MHNQLQKVVQLVNKLGDIGAQNVIDLPRIVVIGSQSSGKSSLLEAIVGMEFLPRGEGVVTRRPLELRLVQNSDVSDLCGAFQDSEDLIYDFREIHDKIVDLTNAVAGTNNGIVDEPIVLTIYGPECANLTLIDLPGITRVPLKNSDQQEDIERVTREMVLRYAKCERTVLLAVIPANQDISTSDALLISSLVDPTGSRTIGVITKVDIMNHGCDAMNMILGKDIPLRLGYIGVKLRSQMDITNGISIEDSIRSETKYFCTHPKYKQLGEGLLGIESLRSSLVNVLFKHIELCLPQIKKEVQQLFLRLMDELHIIGDTNLTTYAAQCEYILKLIMVLCARLRQRIKGKGGTGTEIRRMFRSLLSAELDRDISSDMTDTELYSVIEDYEGDSLAGFPSAECFYYLVQTKLQELIDPVMTCLIDCSKIMEECIVTEVRSLFVNHPRLAAYLVDEIVDLLNEQTNYVKKVLKTVIEAEVSYLFTNSSSYLENHGCILFTPNTVIEDDTLKESVYTTRETKPHCVDYLGMGSTNLVYEMRTRMISYYRSVVESIRETVPKIIGQNILREFIDMAGSNTFSSMLDRCRSNQEELVHLLIESDDIYNERIQLKKRLNTIIEVRKMLSLDRVDPAEEGAEVDTGLHILTETNDPVYAEANKLHCTLVESTNSHIKKGLIPCTSVNESPKTSNMKLFIRRIMGSIYKKDVY